jgi:Zn finger protein HypA/HybF involved in hydrogenase expression
MDNKGGNYKTIKNRCIEEQIDISHIKLGLGSNKGKKFHGRKISIEKILVEDSTFNRTHLKERLIKEKIIEYKCKDCGNIGEWNGKKLSLQLEHKNGRSQDHTKENLCFLCPNCHSQTSTFCGKKKRL